MSTVDPAPFVAWLLSEGERRSVGPEQMAVEAWPNERQDTAARRLRRWVTEAGRVNRRMVEDAIDNLDGSYVDIYGEDVVRLPSGRRKPSHAGIPITVPEDVLIEAHRLHVDEGYSLRKLGRALHHRTMAKNQEALSRILHNAFQQRGWETVDRREAIARFNRAKVDHLPQCTHVHQVGVRKGERCSRRTSSGTCWHHDPERLASLEQRLRPRQAA